MIAKFKEKFPKIEKPAFIADNAVITGDVEIKEDAEFVNDLGFNSLEVADLVFSATMSLSDMRLSFTAAESRTTALSVWEQQSSMMRLSERNPL